MSPGPRRVQPAMHHISDDHLIATIQQDRHAAEFLLSLLTFAAFSPRFPTVLDPIPPTYILDSECDIMRLRADLQQLPPLHTASNRDLFLDSIRHHRNLLEHALFRTPLQSSTPPLLLASAGAPFSKALPQHFTLSTPPPAAHTVRAFHGTSPDRWYSILRNGLRIWPDDGLSVTNGRQFGDAAYLSHCFSVALNFAPHVQLPTRAGPLRSMSAVGHFCIRPGPMVDTTRSTPSIPDSYVVVRDEAAVTLVAISVLADPWPVGNSRRRATSHSWWLYERIGGFGIVVGVYLLVLLLMSWK